MRERGMYDEQAPTITLKGLPDPRWTFVAGVWRARQPAGYIRLLKPEVPQRMEDEATWCSVEGQGRIGGGLVRIGWSRRLQPIMKLLLFHRRTAISESLLSSEDA